MPRSFSRHKSPILIKALLGTGALVAASVLSLSALFLLRTQVAFQRQLELRAGALASSLAAQSQFPLLLANRAELERLARTAMGGDVLYIIVEDASGNYMGGAERAPISRATLPPGTVNIEVPAIRNVRAGPTAEQCVEASVPVIPENEGDLFGQQSSRSEFLGRIRVAMSFQSQRALFLSTLRYMSVIVLLILLAAFAIDYAQVRRLLTPLVELAQVARLVGHGAEAGNLHAVKRGDDEIGVLVDSFNEMLHQVAERTRELQDQVHAKELALAQLAETQHHLIEVSRLSGMAEVATGVLHNVGNVLNSVNVSTTLVAGKIRELRVDKLVSIVDLLQRHEEDLEEFLSRDPKGQRVMPYLSNLAKHLQEERETSLQELELLRNHVGHIKEIVATQQNYAKVSGLTEKIALSDLAVDAFRITQSSLERHQIRFDRDFEELPPVIVDKHKVLQILLNLLRNAKEAIKDSNNIPRVIRVRIRQHGAGHVRIEVKDSGIGLTPENLTRIFAHGFTTKRNGHGFGLHSGALDAKQMGGALWAESEGPGLGATFVLELPIDQTQKENAA